MMILTDGCVPCNCVILWIKREGCAIKEILDLINEKIIYGALSCNKFDEKSDTSVC